MGNDSLGRSAADCPPTEEYYAADALISCSPPRERRRCRQAPVRGLRSESSVRNSAGR